MDKAWKQVLMAVFLGVFAPKIILSAAGWFLPRQTVGAGQSQGEETTAQQPAETVPLQRYPVYLPVMTEAGNVTVMELEAYVRGVVLAEMPASFEEEALKAQAIVARTYALKRQEEGNKHPEGAVCTEPVCCQAYISDKAYLMEGRGDRACIEKVQDAVEDTRGLVLTYQGELIEATYFSCSGGRTEDAAAVWGTDVPYLQAVDSPGEEKANAYSGKLYFTAAEFAAALGRTLAGTPSGWLGKVTYTDGGGVQTMYIGGICYEGTRLRKLLGLNSTIFTMTASDSGITVEMLGHGHRVGMSQYGADAMAVRGNTCGEILAYYYQGTRIDKMQALG